MLEYSYPLFRPPAEANNLILQVTLGCSYNNCSFCSMYKTKNYEVRELEDVFKEIDTLAHHYPNATKIFLADGDALSLPCEQLLILLDKLNSTFTKLRRVSTYASTQNILGKSNKELELLCKSKLNLFYYGIETGSDVVLKKITKSVNQAEIITSLTKATDAGVKISATVILGIGGSKYSDLHVQETAKIINATKVNYLSTLQLGIEEEAKENFYRYFDDFTMADDEQILSEQKRFLELLEPTNKIIFRSNHASNALHLAGTLPKDRDRLVQELKMALDVGKSAFVPNYFRGF
ncbi:MAG: radical SAM protein [Sulfurimonas sp.]|uniref:radical SAM protein n=1 Tax=Sulfurimonas sp. TaxID=2022749 RepID=UPI0026378D69|nr:radical SAM protein [Sulfurimonas sp.]MCW8896253.1 radical SAM protein [Sulfurimonas sp.]MCW8954605.1 radical SAM protein [Sulfurimonas sp.]MCW9067383.1 radical SAM protein [Sulfurimonas sp.]